MSDIHDLIDALVKFRDERDWAQFHDSKNLAAAIGIEAAELNELFLWKTIKESEEVDRERIKEEIVDLVRDAAPHEVRTIPLFHDVMTSICPLIVSLSLFCIFYL